MGIVTETHVIYTVQPGETVYSIASRFSSDIHEIAQGNQLFPPVTDPFLIHPGQVLVVPVIGNANPFTYYIVAKYDRLSDIAERFSTNTAVISGINHLQNPHFIHVGQPLQIPSFIYNLEPNDTLGNIAKRFRVTVDDIVKANSDRPGFSINTLWPAYSIIIPY
ncbi:LysM peptidoglycan-binding domain-containing protein [Oceanobacillus senegalensis]|uniref:LysM peptidoglycan-binding domain-containing protein n=1 Tax=Oceanobacillus senegalensis TaxID=1936063 RepID=UPI000A307967|nr:LysM domain-containing protein [Oceanobacillus senegalensis]